MPFTSREVLIPLVGAGGRGALCRVAADGRLPPNHPAHLDRSISDLLESGLYQAGQQARAAVRRLKLGGGLLNRPAPVALSIVNPGDVTGLAPDNSASAELGLALAMLMYIAQSLNQTVIATGALDVNSADPDGPIRPVHHLTAKFNTAERYFLQSGVPAPPALFFTPEIDMDGAPIEEKHEGAIRALSAIGIEIVPVRSLRAAAARLRALHLRQRPHELWLQRGAAAAAILAAAAAADLLFSAGKSWLSQRPIPMQFLSVSLPDGRIVQTPIRYHKKPDGTYDSLLPCRTAADLPVFRVGDRLAAKVQSGSPDDWAGMFGLNYHVLVAISTPSQTDDASSRPVIKILPLPAPDAVRSGDHVGFMDEVQESDELVVLLAQRFKSFDSNRLARELHELIDPLRPDERVNAARRFLQEASPGALAYVFRTADSTEGCPGE
jgi:hypothetical protein